MRREAGAVRQQGLDDDPRYAAVDGFLEHPVRDFPRLAGAIALLQEALGVRRRGIGAFHLFGSFVRGSLVGEPFEDVDIAAATPEDARRLRPLDGTLVELPAGEGTVRVALDLTPRVFGTPYQLLNRTDFSVTQAVYSYPEERVHLSPRFFEHTASSILVLNPDTGELPLQSLLRVYKYANRGYGCRADTLLGLLSRYADRPRWRIWAESVLQGRRNDHPGARR